jgi:hypothetical protein
MEEKLILELGMAIGRLNETKESVDKLTVKLEEYIKSHEATRKICQESHTKEAKEVSKKIDDHINIDHVSSWKFMNSVMAAKRYAIHLIVIMLSVIFMQFAPVSIKTFVIETIQFIGRLI